MSSGLLGLKTCLVGLGVNSPKHVHVCSVADSHAFASRTLQFRSSQMAAPLERGYEYVLPLLC